MEAVDRHKHFQSHWNWNRMDQDQVVVQVVGFETWEQDQVMVF